MGRTHTFELLDRHGQLASVRLVQEVGLPDPVALRRTRASWQAGVTLPDVDRMEYLFEVEDHNGRHATILDPANPRRVGGAFGEKSELLLDGYHEPAWLTVEPAPGETSDAMWSPAALADGAPAPLLVVHDGPEYDRLGGFTHYLGAMVAGGAIPPVRAALLGPTDRNHEYAADPGYAQDLVTALADVPGSTRIGVGVSLGALAMLHAHRTHPGTFDALLLQSGSFFTPELDPQESGFSGFAAVSAFVASISEADDDPAPVPTVITCGTVEENLANNEAMATQLDRLGYPVTFVPVRDAHNYTAWRDALDPHLTKLISHAA